MQLVLSLFPGAGLFDKGFEFEGFCVVRGPDLLMGGDIRMFHVPPGRFDGIIGGPPCKILSQASIGQDSTHPDMIPEFARIVEQAKPKWYVMENVAAAHAPFPSSRKIQFDAYDVGCDQHRVRAFWSDLDLQIELVPKEQRTTHPWPTVMATEYKYCDSAAGDKRRASRKIGRVMSLEEVNMAMGLPHDFATPALTKQMSYEVRGNGVPVQMARAVAQAVKRATNGSRNT